MAADWLIGVNTCIAINIDNAQHRACLLYLVKSTQLSIKLLRYRALQILYSAVT